MSLKHMNLNKLVTCVNSYCETVQIFQKVYDNLGVSLGIDVFLNYRNALDHYVNCYKFFNAKYLVNKEETLEAFTQKNHEDFIRQETNLHEHLNRGLKDGLLYLVYQYCNILLYMMKEMKMNIPPKSINELREYLHKFKNFALNFRGKKISVTDIEKTTKEEFIKLSVIVVGFEKFMKDDNYFNLNSHCYGMAKNEIKNRQSEFQKLGHFFN